MKSYFVSNDDTSAIKIAQSLGLKVDGCVMSNGKWIFVVSELKYDKESALEAGGMVMLPSLLDSGATLTAAQLALFPVEFGLTTTDSPYTAATKIWTATQFPPHHPRR